MKNYKTCLLVLALIQLSYQYCHYSYSTTLNKKGVCDCFSNFYYSNSNCVQCPNSSMVQQSSTKISDCSICPIDKYLIKEAQLGKSAECLSCPDNSIRPPSLLEQTAQNLSFCSSCNFGYFKIADAVTPSADNGNQAKAAKCQKCPNNTFTPPPARFLPIPPPPGLPAPPVFGPNSSSDSITSCGVCSEGFYATSKPSDGQNADCSLCPNNQSVVIDDNQVQPLFPTYTFKDCNSCIKGYFNAESVPSQPINCLKCPVGTTTIEASSLGIGQCICAQNQYTLSPSSPTSAAFCLPCPTGSGRIFPLINIIGDESQCDACLEGYYLIRPHQDPTDKLSPQGALCKICPKNSYSVAGISTSPSSCSLCKQNYFMQRAADSTNSAECQLCQNNTGTLNPARFPTDKCNVCVAGYYMTKQYQEDQEAQCSQCPPGSNTNPGINTACYCYDQYASWSTTSNSCQCNPGSIGSPATALNTQGCILCPAGTYISSESCIQCPAGTYSSSAGSTSCQTCGSTLTNTDDFTGCKCIDANSNQPTSDSSCVCNPGYIGSPTPSKNSSQSCTACPAGKYFSSGTCIQCPAGTYSSSAGSTSCQTCGSTLTNTDDFTGCKCIDANSNQPISNSSCVCNPGYIGSPTPSKNSSQSCTACPAGQFADSGKCSPCAAGTFSSNAANATCNKCVAGQFASGTGNIKCQACTPGSTNTDDFSGCKCYDSNSVAWNASSNICQCNSNYYGDASKATEAQKSQCNLCQNNLTSKPGAAKTEKDCSSSQSSSSQSSSPQSSSSQSSQQNSQLSFSSVIKISVLIFLILLI